MIVLPPKDDWPEPGAGRGWKYQMWQVNDWESLILTSKCELKQDKGTILDHVHIGERKEIEDQLTWIPREDACLAFRVVTKKVGFNTADWTNRQGSTNTPSDRFIRRIRGMRGPTSTITYTYSYLKKENCKCCPILKDILDRLGVPDGERLSIPGVGTWSS